MYSETAGLSYENPNLRGSRDDQQQGAQPDPELRRVVSYPEAPGRPDGAGADVTGPEARDALESEPRSAGIDALLHHDPFDDDPLVGDRFDIDSFDADPPAPGDGPQGATPQPGRPRLVQPLTGASRPGEGGEVRKGAFRIVVGDGGGSGAGGGDQPGRQRVLDLAMDARMRFWRERLAIMLVVGLVVGIPSGSWIVGLTLAIIAGIAHAVWRSRTVSSIPPGVKLDRAQRITQRKLAGLERAGYRALHARPIPDSPEIIDHLVVGPTGVYAIDSEKWNKKLPIRTRNGRQLWLGPTSKKDRLEHAKWEAGQACELLSARLGREIPVRAALAIYGPQIPWDVAVIRDVDVFNGDRLRRYLKRRAKARDVAKLSRDEVEQIYKAAEAILPWSSAAQSEATLNFLGG